MRKHSFGIAAIAALVAASTASAATRSSFKDLDALGGVSVQSLGGLSYRVTLNTGATLNFGASYDITDIFGFYALSNESDFSPLFALSDIADFEDDSTNSGPGGVQGWRSNPNKGIKPGNSLDFTFDGLDTANNDQWGFHFRVDGTLPGGGNTGFFTFVPAPGSLGLAGLAGLVAIRRRR
jgi:uncharacterized protein (TIGR03382 family)